MFRATDFSETAACAVEHAVVVAKAFWATLHVLHVLEVEIPDALEGLNYLPLNYFEEIEKRAPEQLKKVIAHEIRESQPVNLVIRRGVPFLEIIRYARDQKIDLIVMGTHGRGAVAHALMGSVAEKVVRKSPCPVLTIRHPQHQFVMP
ncbi:MAG: hypothetical protein JWM11_1162 [Planctomycetaceae bacterium]|nr:hypothetical protein [Planctomycetaceae bacterium]